MLVCLFYLYRSCSSLCVCIAYWSKGCCSIQDSRSLSLPASLRVRVRAGSTFAKSFSPLPLAHLANFRLSSIHSEYHLRDVREQWPTQKKRSELCRKFARPSQQNRFNFVRVRIDSRCLLSMDLRYALTKVFEPEFGNREEGKSSPTLQFPLPLPSSLPFLFSLTSFYFATTPVHSLYI